MAQVYKLVDDNGQTRLLVQISPEPAGTFNGGTITSPLEIDSPAAADADSPALTVKGNTVTAFGEHRYVVVTDPTGEEMILVRKDGPHSIELDLIHGAGMAAGAASGAAIYFFRQAAFPQFYVGHNADDGDNNTYLTLGNNTQLAGTGGFNAVMYEGGNVLMGWPNLDGNYDASGYVHFASTDICQIDPTWRLFALVAQNTTTLLGGATVEGAWFTAVHAAPADASLLAGHCAWWFDQTNGAPTVVLKAKQANATVVVPVLTSGGLKSVTQTSGSLPTVQLVSGTGAQILTTRDAETVTPCTFNPGAATTATVTVALSPDNVTYSTLGVETEPVGVAFDGTIRLVKVRVPAGWYLKLTVNAQATLGLTTYY